jgi:hypothetical protein
MISRKYLRFFQDLSVYKTDEGLIIPDVLNVGWLGSNVDFETGEPPHDFVNKLMGLMEVSSPPSSQKLVMGIWRGIFRCPLCGITSLDIQENWEIKRKLSGLGIAELWVPSISRKGMYYSSSTWICHYIIDHQYLPPAEYIESVLTLDKSQKINMNLIAFDLDIKYSSQESGIPADQDYVSLMHKIIEEY